MRTVTYREASRDFSKIAKIARTGEPVSVTRRGLPWVTIVAPGAERKACPVVLPDFVARLKSDFPKPISGSFIADLISEGRGE